MLEFNVLLCWPLLFVLAILALSWAVFVIAITGTGAGTLVTTLVAIGCVFFADISGFLTGTLVLAILLTAALFFCGVPLVTEVVVVLTDFSELFEKFIRGLLTGSEFKDDELPELFIFVFEARCVKGASEEIEFAMRLRVGGTGEVELTGGSISFMKFSSKSSSWSSCSSCRLLASLTVEFWTRFS